MTDYIDAGLRQLASRLRSGSVVRLRLHRGLCCESADSAGSANFASAEEAANALVEAVKRATERQCSPCLAKKPKARFHPEIRSRTA